MTPHIYVRNQAVVPVFAWYFLIKIGCGTGNSPTRVPCCKNFKISDSSVNPLEQENEKWNSYKLRYRSKAHLSMHIFSTCGTSTCNNRIIVCSGNFVLHEDTCNFFQNLQLKYFWKENFSDKTDPFWCWVPDRAIWSRRNSNTSSCINRTFDRRSILDRWAGIILRR